MEVAQTAQQLAADTKAKVMNLLHWNEEQYGQFQYEQGLTYLEQYIPGDAEGINMLTRSRIFWNWWKNHWQIRDMKYLRDYPGKDTLTDRRECYKVIHSAYFLIDEIYPSATVLGNDYCKMIGEVNDTLNKSGI